MNHRNCIGVVLTQPAVNYQRNVLDGIYKKAFELDLNVAVFYTPTKEGCFADSAECEEQIFNLPNPEKLYGIVFMPDVINFKHIDKIKERYRSITGCPVICLDIEEEGFVCLTSTDSNAVSDNILHLHEVHGCADIAYMTGIKGHPHAESRLQIYRDTMAKLGLAVKEDRIYYGDFWYFEGENFVKKLMESPDGMPQAIACASNRMAHSVCEALKKYNISVPDEVIVTGFWENDAELSYISSVGKNSADTGYRAVEMLDEIRKGVKYEKKCYSADCSSVIKRAASCGCADDGNHTVSSGIAAVDFEEDIGYFSLYNNMRDSLQEADDFYDFFWKMDWHTIYLKPFRHFSFAFSKGWDTPKGTETFTDEMFLVYSTDYDKEKDDYDRRVQFDISFDIKEIHPILWEDTEKPCVFYIEPLYTKKRCYGFAVLSYGDTGKIPDTCYRFWIKDVKLGLEAQRRMSEIQSLYAQMQKSAITNLMTGLYNRNGFHSISGEMLVEAKEKDEKIAVIMADLNCLKYINDTFGHEAGDTAIKTAANALTAIKCPNSTREENFRMGGDEFVKVVSGNISNIDIMTCINDISAHLEQHNKEHTDFPVILSMGSALDDADGLSTVFELVGPADKEMLDNKAIVKKKTNFDHKRKQ